MDDKQDSINAAIAFSAVEAIAAGSLDRYLLRLRAAIEERRHTEAYQHHIVAGEPD